MISMDMLRDAQRVLAPVINYTPVVPTKGIVPGCDFYLKADCLQKTGAFKLRGAYYKIATLSDEEKSRGVIACSAGNHAQGVAFAARDMGIKATICIPEGAPISKIEATRSYGANVVLVPGVYDDAYAEAVRLRDEHGLTFIHPFNDYHIMAGQGTIGLEILDQLPDVDAVIVPVGGGGLISGVAFGGETGFLVGAMTMLASNFLFSQGPWTPFQMFAAGIIGFLAGVLFRKGWLRRSRAALCSYGAIAAIVLYGGLMNPVAALLSSRELSWQVLMSYYITGFPVDCVYAAATVFFLWVLAEPMLEKLDRIKTKYGLVE